MPKKMGKRLMTVCSLAVTAVYAAGYMYTLPAAQANASGASPLTTSSTASSSSGTQSNSTQTPASSGSAASKPSSHPSSGNSHAATARSSTQHKQSHTKKTAAHAAKYKDGTYAGLGTNAYGSVGVSVTISNGKIASVNITQCTTHYPQSVIDPQLPQEVVSMQTWKIYVISGATASTYDFAEAVYQALQKAKV